MPLLFLSEQKSVLVQCTCCYNLKLPKIDIYALSCGRQIFLGVFMFVEFSEIVDFLVYNSCT